MFENVTWSGALALASGGAAALILIVYLIKRPAFALGTQLWLLLGLGVFPMLTAASGSVAGYEATKSVKFCSSCHVMLMHTGDAHDPRSQSLAARHSRNSLFGEASCFQCHADYGMFGEVFTKVNGMHHVYEYLREYHAIPLEAAVPRIELYKPYPNHNCMQCHSTTNKFWLNVAEHSAAVAELRTGEVSCASAGCHGSAHPFSKAAKKLARDEKARREGRPIIEDAGAP